MDCARAVGVDLSNAGSAAGSKVTWRDRNNGRADLSSRTGADSELSQDKTSRYRYRSGQEDAELAKSLETETFALEVWASVARNDVQKARELFTKLLLDQLPEALRGIVSGLAKDFLDTADRHLTAITGVNASGRVFITYHAREPTPTPSIPDPGNGGRKATTANMCSDAGLISIAGAETAWIDNGACGTPAVIVVLSNGTLKVTGGDGGRDEIIAVAERILSTS